MTRIKNICIALAYGILGIIKLPFTLAVVIVHTIEVWMIIAMAKLATLSTMERFKCSIGDMMDVNAYSYYTIYEELDDLADKLHGWKL